eukprot:scaffold80479_cov67-Phaeocystis_antarctica.AAC.3
MKRDFVIIISTGPAFGLRKGRDTTVGARSECIAAQVCCRHALSASLWWLQPWWLSYPELAAYHRPPTPEPTASLLSRGGALGV